MSIVKESTIKALLAVVIVLGAVACNPAAGGPASTATLPPQAPTATGGAEATKPATAVATPTAMAAQATPSAQVPVVVQEPTAGQRVTSPIHVAGQAMVYEGTVHVEVLDANGNVLGRGFTTASEGAPGAGDFAADIAFDPPAVEVEGLVRMFGDNPRTGVPDGPVEIPVTIAPGR
jgi:hypothetical protein